MITQDMTDEEYFAHPAINASSLKVIDSSLAEFDEYRKKESKSTPSMSIGSVAHALILEGSEAMENLIGEKYHVLRLTDENAPVNPSTGSFYGEKSKKFIDWEEEFAGGKPVISELEFDRIAGMAKAIKRHPMASKLFAMNGKAEVAIFATDEETGLEMKIKVDWLLKKVMVDLKTCADSTFRGFRMACYKFKYWLQDLHYTNTAKAAGLDIERFVFIAVQSTPPFCVAVYELTLEGSTYVDRYRETLENYKGALETGDFSKGHSDDQEEPITIEL